MYRIKVPNGRRVILEVVNGRSIVQSCDSYRLLENIFKEKLVVKYSCYISLFLYYAIIILNINSILSKQAKNLLFYAIFTMSFFFNLFENSFSIECHKLPGLNKLCSKSLFRMR